MKFKNTVIAVGVGLFTTLLSACGGSTQDEQPPVISHAEGEELVIATSVAVTEILDALGVKVAGVPTTSYELPESVKDAVEIGNPMSPDLEIIKSLNPTVVVSVDTLGSDYMALFEQNNIPSQFVSLQSLEGLKEAITTLGQRFEVEEKADELITQIEDKEASIQAEVAELEKPQILLLFGAPGATMIATSQSYVGNLVEIVGGENIIDESAAYTTLNKEYIATLNPDQILVMIHALPEATKAALEQEMATDTMWQSMSAVQEGRVVFLDHNYFGLSADLSVIEGLELLKEIIHTTGE